VGVSDQHACDVCGVRSAKTIEPFSLSYLLLCGVCPLPNIELLLGAARASMINLGTGKKPAMHVSAVYPGRWLKAADLAGKPLVLSIASADLEELEAPDGKAEKKLVLKFADHEKSMVVNKTNLRSIAEMHGDETDGWTNKQIEVYPDRTFVGSKKVACIRVREPGAAAFNDSVEF
jgi:hypothetical protein